MQHQSTCREPVNTAWRICAEMYLTAQGKPRKVLPALADVHATCIAAGVAPGTTVQQTYRFRKFHKLPIYRRHAD